MFYAFAFLHIWNAVHTEIPHSLASPFKLVFELRLSLRSCRISAVVRTFLGGLPNRVPRAFALRRPARTRSPIKEASRAAQAPSTVITSTPARRCAFQFARLVTRNQSSKSGTFQVLEADERQTSETITFPHHYKFKPTAVSVRYQAI
jgi:hypothetical protein